MSFIVLMAGTGVSGGDILLKQQEDIGRINGTEESSVKLTRDINKDVYQKISQISDTAKLSIELRAYLKSRIKDIPAKDIPKDMKEEDMLNAQLTATLNPWMLNFIRYNPASTLEKVKCSVLALNGDKDLQVCSKINLPAIESALKKGGNTHYTIKELPGLNHLFQECKTGSPSEYAEIEQTVSPKALETMTSWIKTICR